MGIQTWTGVDGKVVGSEDNVIETPVKLLGPLPHTWDSTGPWNSQLEDISNVRRPY